MVAASHPCPPRRPGRPPRPDTATARANLLDLATQLFAAQGVAATTIANIAQRAGVTPAMLHYYFKTRDQLIDAVVLERIVPVIGFVWAPVPLEPREAAGGRTADGMPVSAPPDPASAARGFITEIVGRVVQSATEKPWLPSLWMHEVVNEGGQLRDRVLRHLPSDRLQAFAGLIAECQRRGAITPGVEPRLVFLSILGMTLLPLATSNLWRRIWQNDPVAQTIDNEAIARHAIAMLTGGLFAPAAPPIPTSSGR
ncbi:TetR/AcrR family transcriptional regulator [Achromobacter mucicolens]|uniref:TetR/AcrR family transcriptional regulator n=1 Tax=Achromobacter mucicolens TaxID=1389922 RepID=UPI0007C7AC64|nr:TetR family transcriptional regulator [Achromobacter mucicolens]OAE58491.1 TetR family transcriptional regulator [Achromobacter xylosoxidans]PTX05878.1 TetR/AcrR family transcriptional regulator [Achromobacter mucicolens]